MIKDMTEGNPAKLLLSFAIPLFFSSCVEELYNIADSIIVGRLISTEALAAVGATGSMIWLIFGFVKGLTQGFSIIISQCFGNKNHQMIRKAIIMSIYLSMLFASIVSVIGSLNARNLLLMTGTPKDIIDGASLYLSIILGGALSTFYYNINASALYALGNSKAPLYVSIFSSLLNIILDIWFINNLGLGIAGAAYATVLSQLLAGFLCMLILRKVPFLIFNKKDFIIDISLCTQLLKTGLPVAIMNSITAIGTVILQSVVNTLGSVSVAAYTIGTKIIGVADQSICVVGVSIGTFVSQNTGAKKFDRTKSGVRSALLISLVFSISIGLLIIIFGKNLSSMFVGTESSNVIEETYPYLLICSSMLWCLGFLFVFRYSLQGLGNTLVPMISGILELISRVFIVYVLPASLGFLRICFAEVSAWLSAMLLLYITYAVTSKKNI
jgi:putative MATE family efflux protein